MKRSTTLIMFTLSVLLCTPLMAQPKPVAWWTFDEAEGRDIKDKAANATDKIEGNFERTTGVSGKALQLDGYTTRIVRPAAAAPKLDGAFTAEAYVALAAYPWTWAPIAAREHTVTDESTRKELWWPKTMVEGKHRGWYFGIGPRGEVGFHYAIDGKWKQCNTKDFVIPLRKWVHVTATYDPKSSATVYINGKQAATLSEGGTIDMDADQPLRIGMNREPRKASHPVRPFATLATWFALDGLLDEVKLYDQALDKKTIAKAAAGGKKAKMPLKPRRLPFGPKGPNKFGATYEHLEYYPAWDNLWRVGDHSDIVVRFDDSPIRVIFWRGMRYSPAWVMENGDWMGDQSIENFNGTDGCIEHMLDPFCKFSHVRIIENTPARVVVHWRYCPIAANRKHSRTDPVSGMTDWVDEYFTFYPNGTAMRGVILHTSGDHLWPQEFIAMCHPGQEPEDVVDLKAMTLVNTGGKAVTYSWENGAPHFLKNRADREADPIYFDFGTPPEERPVIGMVNYKSKYKPYEIFEYGSRIKVFRHELREDASHFPWWNHWPVAMIPSDGRYAQAPDRAGHFSLAWGGVVPHDGPGPNQKWWSWMYGATDQPATSLVPLARSFCVPPKITVEGKGYTDSEYRQFDRAYHLKATGRKRAAATIKLTGSEKSPVVDPAIVITGWGDRPAKVSVDGQALKAGKKLRVGHHRKGASTDLVLFIPMSSTKPVSITVAPK